MTSSSARKYYLVKFFSEASFYIPVWLLFLRDYCGASETQAFLMQSTLLLSIVLCEIPSGAWADRFSRRQVLIISAELNIIGYSLYCLSTDFLLLLCANILLGIACAASSGTIEALVTDNLRSEGIETEGVFENGHALFFVGRAMTVGIAGFLYGISPILPYMFCLIYSVILLICICMLTEAPYQRSTAKNNYSHLKETIKLLLRNQFIYRWLLCATVTFLFSTLGWFQYQSLFPLYGWAPTTIGLIYSWGALCSCIGSWTSKRIPNRLRGSNVLFLCTVLWAAGTLGITVDHLFVVLGGILLSSLASGAIFPGYVRIVNNSIGADQRATAISMIGFANILACAVGVASAGYLNEIIGAVPLTRAAGVILFVLAVFPVTWVRKSEVSV